MRTDVQYDEHVQYYYHVWLGVMTKILYGGEWTKQTRLSDGTLIRQTVDPNTIYVFKAWSV